jgi:DNA (cytosine-5)-methyltransferase 1
LIPQHIAPKLSELDLMVARAVPPGGNWKDVPESVPSKRLETIRSSYARGEGSRSTYYGRLAPNAPAYTISTYFTRPGNGCHLHYDASQLRTVSYREAARIQSFPDSFVFSGPKSAIANQIGNAVPPVLAYSLANSFGPAGDIVDLFSGCGGLALGFKWAGWQSLIGSDIDERALETFSHNITPRVVLGDIRNSSVCQEIVSNIQSMKVSGRPLVVVGGPPCQGFSTAGKARSREDERNHLFQDYCKLVEEIDPDAFLFENVTGLLNMEKGQVFAEVLQALGKLAVDIKWWKVRAEEYGVPQRRTRVIVVGIRRLSGFKLTAPPLSGGLMGVKPVSVSEALDDLPPLSAGQDGSSLGYLRDPTTGYQRLMRGYLDPKDYFQNLLARKGSEVVPFESSWKPVDSKSKRGLASALTKSVW